MKSELLAVTPAGCDRKSFRVTVANDRRLMGQEAAREVGAILRHYTATLEKKVLAIFAAAPSQDDFLGQLVTEKGIDWRNVIAVHLDEYIDLPADHPNTFRQYLKEHAFSKLPIPAGNISFIKDLAGDAAAVSAAYGAMIRSRIDEVHAVGGIVLAFIGIGVNGHIAFNEPGTDLRTKSLCVPVTIDEVSVKQQFDDYKDHPNPAARYRTLADVPRNAVTVSVGGILSADVIFCIVPGRQKSAAVKESVEGAITDAVPASYLRLHHDTRMFIDADAGSLLTQSPSR